MNLNPADWWIAGEKILDLKERLKYYKSKIGDPEPFLNYARLGLAETYRKPEDFPGVIENLENIMGSGPKLLEMWIKIGIAKDTETDYIGAIDAFNKALSYEPENENIHTLLGYTRLNQNRFDAAIQDFEISIKSASATIYPFIGLGMAKSRKGDHLGALQAFEKAISINPDFPNVWLDVGKEKTAIGDKEGAGKAFERVELLNPNEASIWVDLGFARDDSGNREKAIKDFEKATEIDPKSALNWLYLGYIKNTNGDHTGAIKSLEIAQSLDPFNEDPFLDPINDQILCKLKETPNYLIAKKLHLSIGFLALILSSVAKLQIGDLEGATQGMTKARKFLEKVTERDPTNKLVSIFLGISKIATGDYGGGIQTIKNTATKNPPNFLISLIQVISKVKIGDAEGAEQEFQKMNDMEGNDLLSLLPKELATELVDSSNLETLVKLSGTLDLPKAFALLYFGLLKQKNEDRKGSIESLSKAIQLFQKEINSDSRNSLALIGLSKASEALGDHDGAMKYLEQASMFDPSNVKIWRLIGALQARLGNFDVAKSAYSKAKGEVVQTVDESLKMIKSFEKIDLQNLDLKVLREILGRIDVRHSIETFPNLKQILNPPSKPRFTPEQFKEFEEYGRFPSQVEGNSQEIGIFLTEFDQFNMNKSEISRVFKELHTFLTSCFEGNQIFIVEMRQKIESNSKGEGRLIELKLPEEFGHHKYTILARPKPKFQERFSKNCLISSPIRKDLFFLFEEMVVEPKLTIETLQEMDFLECCLLFWGIYDAVPEIKELQENAIKTFREHVYIEREERASYMN